MERGRKVLMDGRRTKERKKEEVKVWKERSRSEGVRNNMEGERKRKG